MGGHLVGLDEQLAEHAISSNLSTSRNAVRQALQMLANDGVVVRKPHNGTKLVREMVRAHVNAPMFLGMDEEEAKRRVKIELLERVVVPAAPLVTQLLNLPGDSMLVVEYLVLLDGDPISIDSGYHAPDVPAERFRIGQDQDDVFRRFYGAPLGVRRRSVQAITADPATARTLDVPEGSPLLLQELLMFDANGVPRELRHTHYRADRAALILPEEEGKYPRAQAS
jgi:DNA-binding GntR family transcriptional regulator